MFQRYEKESWKWEPWKDAILREMNSKKVGGNIHSNNNNNNGNNEATLLLYQKWKCKAKIEKVQIEDATFYEDLKILTKNSE